jgi:hypothetical protein
MSACLYVCMSVVCMVLPQNRCKGSDFQNVRAIFVFVFCSPQRKYRGAGLEDLCVCVCVCGFFLA